MKTRVHRKWSMVVVLALMALAVMGAAGGRPFTSALTGPSEVPLGDPDGSGTVSLTLNPGLEEVCFALSVSNISLPAIGAHIHAAPAGVAGPVVVPLTPPDASGFSSGCVHADRDLILAILRNPENYYVNVHTTDFPTGAVRGQLSR